MDELTPEEIAKHLPRFMELYNKVAQVFIDEKVLPRDMLLIISAMSESVYSVLVNDSEYFNKATIEQILKLMEE